MPSMEGMFHGIYKKERIVKVKLVFHDWNVYNTEKGVELSSGDFHSGTTFDGDIYLDDNQEEELKRAFSDGYTPSFVVFGNYSAKELRDEFEKNLKELQHNCPHIESTWMLSEWAPGHYGPKVKVCKECGKILEREVWKAVIKDISETSSSSYGYQKEIIKVDEFAEDVEDK